LIQIKPKEEYSTTIFNSFNNSRNTNNPIFKPVFIGTKHIPIEQSNESKYVTLASRRRSSNINLHCRLGPDRNVDEANDNMFPDVYMKTKGAGFPNASLMSRWKDANVIR